MACGACRKPKQIRTPNSTGGNRSTGPVVASSNNSDSTGDQRSRITGLNYVPKK